MTEQEKLRRAAIIKTKIEESKRILIISSKPVDLDTLATSLTLQWWIQKFYDIKTDIVTFAQIPEMFKKQITAAPDVVKEKYPNQVNFKEYDLIISIDANAWYMVFGMDYTLQDLKIDLSKVVHIDHHTDNEIHADLGERSFAFKDACTSKIVFNYFIKPSGIEVPTFVANWMMQSLLGDTGTFNWEIHPGTFTYAEDLTQLGAAYQELVELRIPKQNMDYLQLLLPKVKYYPEIESQVLIISDDENELLSAYFGDDWAQQRMYSYFNEVVFRRIAGYNYGFTFTKDFKRGGVDASWRARNSGDLISVQKLLQSLGFEAGGHPGAGGGYNANTHIHRIEEAFIKRMKEALADKPAFQL